MGGEEVLPMNTLQTIAIVILVLWLLGFIGLPSIGGIIHVL
ncbi:MAG: lmo0937 family membrane protein, partial [archaeon]|nr:lmo0937 family membrane protein [archaeon]